MTRTATIWQRVSRRRPCPVCERPDWCLYVGPVDSPTAAICARVESPKRCGESGWLHKLKEDPLRPTPRRVQTVAVKSEGRPIQDFGGFARLCHFSTLPQALGQLADALGLSRESLGRLLVGWSAKYQGWAFPMCDAAGNVVGVRLRLPSGRKLAVRGGREGLFLVEGLQPGGRLLVCEGPTDTAACLDWGFQTVGRPSCTGGVRHVVELVKRLAPEEVVILADGDAPGQRGAERLAAVLAAYCPAIRVITPPGPHKDVRAWKQAGATSAAVATAIDGAPVRRLAVTCKRKGRCTDARRNKAR